MNEATSGGFPLALLSTVIALAAVLAIAWLALRLLARAGVGGAVRPGGRLKVLQSVPVGTRERLVLVRYEAREYLLGVTAGGVSVIERGAVTEESGGPGGNRSALAPEPGHPHPDGDRP